MEKKLKQIIFILAGISFFVPIVVLPSSFIFPFIVPKVLLLRIIFISMFVCFILLNFIDSKQYKIKITPITIGVSLFLVSSILSTFLGVDWYRSFWDNHERMLGLFTFFHYVFYYLVITTVFRDQKYYKKLIRLFLFAGSIVMLVGIIQRFFNPQFLLNTGASRVTSTLGNSIYVSGYGLFLFFLGIVSYIKEKEEGFIFWWRYALVCAALGFFGIFLGGTRGTLLGLVFGLGIILVMYLFEYAKNKKIRNILFSIIIGMIILAGVLFSFRTTKIVRNIPAVGGILNLSFSSGTSNTRIMAWGIAVDAWKEKPLLGWGPNNYYYAFNKYYRPEFLDHGYSETWFDNAHNIIMNTLATQGMFGLLSYLSLFLLVIFSVRRCWKKGSESHHILIFFIGFLTAHFIHNIFVFENPTSYLYFFFILAYINSLTQIEKEIEKNNRIIKKRKATAGSVVVLAIILILFVYATDINTGRANTSLITVIRSIASGNISTEPYNKVTQIPSPHIDDIRNDFVRYASDVINILLQNNKKDGIEQLFLLSYGELVKNRDLHPMDIRVNLMQAKLAQQGFIITKDPKWLFEEEKVLEDAIVFSPKRQQLEYMLATAKLHLKKYDEAKSILQESIDNNSKIAEGWLRLASAYYDEGQKEVAVSTIEEARGLGIIFSSADESVIKLITSSSNAGSL